MVMGLLMFLVLMWSLFTCGEASANWVGTQTLIPGKYMMIDVNLGATFQAAYLKAMLTPEQRAEKTMNLMEIMSGMTFEIDKDKNTNGLVHLLNMDPVTRPDSGTLLFYWNEAREKWINIPLPCKFVEGEVDL